MSFAEAGTESMITTTDGRVQNGMRIVNVSLVAIAYGDHGNDQGGVAAVVWHARQLWRHGSRTAAATTGVAAKTASADSVLISRTAVKKIWRALSRVNAFSSKCVPE